MTGSETRLMRQLVSVALVLLGGNPPFAQSLPSPPSILSSSSSSRGPPPLPQYYVTSSHRPPSVGPAYPTSSLAPTSPVYAAAQSPPVYTAQRIRPSDYIDRDNRYDDPYPAAAGLSSNLDVGKSQDYDESPVNTGFVEPIDFSGLLKDIGDSPKTAPLVDIQSGNSNPLFASESKDTFQGFFGSTKNPFEELSRLHTASSDHNSRQTGNDEDNVGFVDPNVQFRSLFDSAGTSSSSATGFGPSDFLGSKSENIGSAPSKGSQTRAYPSFTYTGRGNERDREEEDYPRGGSGGGGGGGGGGPNRYRSSYRQVNGGGDNRNNDYYPSNDYQNNSPNPDYQQTNRGGQYDDYDGISNNSPSTDSYDDYDNRGPSYVASPATGRRGNGGSSSERGSSPRYSPAAQETAQSPQSKPRTSAADSKNPRCKKVEKSLSDFQNDDSRSFTEPDDDYDPSTYQGRYKRQARQKSRSNGRPMTCYVCEDEHGRYAEKCSYDSKASPNNKDGNNYYHSESSSFSDNGRNNNNRPRHGSKGRNRRNSNRQRYSSEDPASAESTTKAVSVPAEIAESEPAKVIGKRQSGDFYGGGGGGGGGRQRNNENQDDFRDPYDGSTGAYAHPSGYEGPRGYEGPPLGDSSGDRDGYGRGHGHGGGGRGGGYHGSPGGGGGGRGGGGGYHGSPGGGYDSSDYNVGNSPDYEREASSAVKEYDFSIPREFDPDYQLGGGGNRNGNNNRNQRREDSPQDRAPVEANDFQFYPDISQAFQASPRDGPSRGGLHQSASNRQDNLDDFDIGYNDYIRQNFPEALNSPGSSTGFASPAASRDYEFTPNYYHRPRSENNNQGGGRGGGHGEGRGGGGGHGEGRGGGGGGYHHRSQSPEVSFSPSDNSHRGYHHERERPSSGRGHYAPNKEHTQPSHHFSPPPGFYAEDSPNDEKLGSIIKEFSSRTRDGCRKVNKGDMTCYVCRDAKGGNKEECMYASNDPKNKAMAYHEVTEYSSPMGQILPAPLHASLLGHPEKIEGSANEGIPSWLAEVTASSPLASSPTAVSTNQEQKQSSSVIIPKTVKPLRIRVVKEVRSTQSITSSSSTNDDDSDSSSKRTTTEKPQKRSKRSLKQLPGAIKNLPNEYDFDY